MFTRFDPIFEVKYKQTPHDRTRYALRDKNVCTGVLVTILY